jgi:iron-only hydrogenase group A
MGRSRKSNRTEEDNIMQIDKKKCIGCTACAFTCAQETKISILKKIDIGKRIVEPKQGTFEDTGCIYCGQCAVSCPTEAMKVRNDVELVKEALNSGKYLVLIASPVVKATLGEEFDLPAGTYVEGKIVPSARKLGFQNIFNTEFGADMTAVEEATELIKRIAGKENLPMFTSFCPAWVRYAELFHPEILEYISTAKSPQQMMGASIKTYFANNYNILPTNIFSVSLNSCAAKKYEAERAEMGRDNYRDVDAVLTTKEYSELLKENGIDITAMADESFTPFMNEYTGAGTIFAISGGAMKSVIRTTASYLNSNIFEIDNADFENVLGYEYIKEANINLGSQGYKVAIINGLKEIDKFLKSEKWKEYLFIEVMTCNNGCMSGGGAVRIEKKSKVNEELCISCGTCIENCPASARAFDERGEAFVDMRKCVGCELCMNICRSKATKVQYFDKITNDFSNTDYVKNRIDALKNIDKMCEKKVSDENDSLQDMYKIYMEEPGSIKAINLLHTGYIDRSNNIKSRNPKKRKKH